jgi:hypothetical protein
MSYVIAAPEMIAAAATDVATIGSNVSAAHMVAAAPTVAVVPAAADEVSAGIARVFSQHAADYQALAGRAAAFNDQFVQRLTAGAFSYASIEAAIASFLQDLNVNADQVIFNSLSLPLVQNIDLVLFDALILAWYAAAALQHFLMTGQILSFSVFISSLFRPLLGP